MGGDPLKRFKNLFHAFGRAGVDISTSLQLMSAKELKDRHIKRYVIRHYRGGKEERRRGEDRKGREKVGGAFLVVGLSSFHQRAEDG